MNTEMNENIKNEKNGQNDKRKWIITGSLAVILLILVIVAGVFVFGACGIDYTETDTNTVFVLKDGKIVSTDIEAFNENTYSEDKLEAYVTEVVDAYNKGKEEAVVTQKKLIVEENVATLVLEYANQDVYEKVNGVELFAGTIKEAQTAGYTFEANFAKIGKEKVVAAKADDFMNGEDYKVVIIKSNTKVVVPGEVCFVSTQNIAKVGEDYVLIKDGTELLAEEEEVYSTEFGTEAEGSDGSISEDDMANTDGEIIFDFGDAEVEDGSQYSEVLTYIIYK